MESGRETEEFQTVRSVLRRAKPYSSKEKAGRRSLSPAECLQAFATGATVFPMVLDESGRGILALGIRFVFRGMNHEAGGNRDAVPGRH